MQIELRPEDTTDSTRLKGDGLTSRSYWNALPTLASRFDEDFMWPDEVVDADGPGQAGVNHKRHSPLLDLPDDYA